MNVKTKLSDCLRPVLLGALLIGTVAHAEVRSIDKVVAIVDNDVVPWFHYLFLPGFSILFLLGSESRFVS